MKKEEYITLIVQSLNTIEAAGILSRLRLHSGYENLPIKDLQEGLNYLQIIIKGPYKDYMKMESQMPKEYWKRHDSFSLCTDTEEHMKRKKIIADLWKVCNTNKKPNMFKRDYVRSKNANNKRTAKQKSNKPGKSTACHTKCDEAAG